MLNSESIFVEDCFFSKIPDAVEISNINSGIIRNNHFENIPDDAIDLNNCANILIDSNFIINVEDRGMEIGSEGNGNSENIVVKRNVFVNCHQGVTFKENSYGQIINNTYYGNEIGVKCIENNGPRAGSSVEIINCIFSNSTDYDIFHDVNSTINVSYSISNFSNLQGQNNLFGDPLFTDAANYNFNLNADSPCINTGDPLLPLDADSTISDIGALFFNTDTINSENEIFNDISIVAFPNPFNTKFTRTLQEKITNNITVELYTRSGIKVPTTLNYTINSNKTIIDVKVLPANNKNRLLICRLLVNGNLKSFLVKQQVYF